MKFGDPVINTAATEGNPHKRALFVRRSGSLSELTDGKGSFWRTDSEVIEAVPDVHLGKDFLLRNLRNVIASKEFSILQAQRDLANGGWSVAWDLVIQDHDHEIAAIKEDINNIGGILMPKPTPSPEHCYILLGQRIRHLRQMKLLTQDELAAKVKMTRTSVVNIEAGKQRVMPHDIRAFADALSVKVDRFIVSILTEEKS